MFRCTRLLNSSRPDRPVLLLALKLYGKCNELRITAGSSASRRAILTAETQLGAMRNQQRHRPGDRANQDRAEDRIHACSMPQQTIDRTTKACEYWESPRHSDCDGGVQCALAWPINSFKQHRKLCASQMNRSAARLRQTICRARDASRKGKDRRINHKH